VTIRPILSPETVPEQRRNAARIGEEYVPYRSRYRTKHRQPGCRHAFSGFFAGRSKSTNLTGLAAWINDHNIPFLVTGIGMIVMLLWAGSYKLTAPGAEGIIPLVSNSPLTSWHFKLFGPYIGSDIIGLTEITGALLIAAGYFRPKAGVIGGLITTVMFFTTSTMLLTTPARPLPFTA
jgi:uncharacterized membrane protein YphA (DoxX/SURF4 family)